MEPQPVFSSIRHILIVIALAAALAASLVAAPAAAEVAPETAPRHAQLASAAPLQPLVLVLAGIGLVAIAVFRARFRHEK